MQREIELRLGAEEKLTNLTPKVTSLESELQNIQANLEGTTNALNVQKVINKELREELQKLTKLKEALEEDLKEALIKSDK